MACASIVGAAVLAGRAVAPTAGPRAAAAPVPPSVAAAPRTPQGGSQSGTAPAPAASAPARAWKIAKVTQAGAVIRASASGGAAPRYTCRKSQMLMVGPPEGDWCPVALEAGQTGWIARSALKSLGLRAVEVVPGVARNDIVADAMKFLWAPYVHGGTSVMGADCSGLVQTVFRRHGVELPRTASEQFGVGAPVYQRELEPGDRVFFSGKDGVVNHVGIYVGDGSFIHASGRHGKVFISKLSEYQDTYAGARR